jgi:hypothetical protein
MLNFLVVLGKKALHLKIQVTAVVLNMNDLLLDCRPDGALAISGEACDCRCHGFCASLVAVQQKDHAFKRSCGNKDGSGGVHDYADTRRYHVHHAEGVGNDYHYQNVRPSEWGVGAKRKDDEEAHLLGLAVVGHSLVFHLQHTNHHTHDHEYLEHANLHDDEH